MKRGYVVKPQKKSKKTVSFGRTKSGQKVLIIFGGMIVYFNFPNEIAFKLDLQLLPRKGDEISLSKIERSDNLFDDEDYLKYEAEQYQFKDWIVDEVIWYPMAPEYTFVNLVLKEKI